MGECCPEHFHTIKISVNYFMHAGFSKVVRKGEKLQCRLFSTPRLGETLSGTKVSKICNGLLGAIGQRDLEFELHT